MWHAISLLGIYHPLCQPAGLVSGSNYRELLLAIPMVLTPPIIAGTGTYLSTRNQQPGIKTHLDKVINYIWLVFGITGFLISMLAMFFWQLPILFIILLLMGMGTTLTGLVVGYKTVTICGTLGALSSIGCLFYPGPNQILIFAPVFIFMMVIPGHVLNHAARKQKKS